MSIYDGYVWGEMKLPASTTEVPESIGCLSTILGWDRYAAEGYIHCTYGVKDVITLTGKSVADIGIAVSADTAVIVTDGDGSVIDATVYPASCLSGALTTTGNKTCERLVIPDDVAGLDVVGDFCDWDPTRAISGQTTLIYLTSAKCSVKFYDAKTGEWRTSAKLAISRDKGGNINNIIDATWASPHRRGPGLIKYGYYGTQSRGWAMPELIGSGFTINKIWDVSEPEMVGVMPVRQDVILLPTDEPGQPKTRILNRIWEIGSQTPVHTYTSEE